MDSYSEDHARAERLEKEADWLALELADIGMLRRPCGKECNPCDLTCRQEQWREAARKAVEGNNEQD